MCAPVAAALLAACTAGAAEPGAQQPPLIVPRQPVLAEDIASLVVPVDQLAGRPLLGELHPSVVDKKPRSTKSDACYEKLSDDSTVFGDGFLAFRGVSYSGAGNLHVYQAISVFESSAKAREMFDAAAQIAASCTGPDGRSLVTSPVGDRISWTRSGFNPVTGSTGEMSASSIRVQDNVLYRVVAGLLDNQNRAIADDVADRIAFNIRLFGN